MAVNPMELRDTVLRITGVNPRKCMKCGKCSGTCPAYDQMEYHPHQFVAMVEKGDIERLMASPSVFMCLSCFACVERCPRGVEPAKLIEGIRLAMIRQKDANHMTMNDIPRFWTAKCRSRPLPAPCANTRNDLGHGRAGGGLPRATPLP